MSNNSESLEPPIEVQIRPLVNNEIDIISTQLNPMRGRSTHQIRIQKQNDGTLLYLIAWQQDKPIAHAQIIWNGPIGSPKQYLNFECPYIEDLWVTESLRSQGIGKKMLIYMENLAASNGHRKIGLSVGIHNLRAIKLYKRIGYHSIGIPNFTLSGTVIDVEGDLHFWSEECQYMLKQLQIKA